jgi:hypothetical protein
MGQRMHCREPAAKSPESNQKHGKTRNAADAPLARMPQAAWSHDYRAIPTPSDRVNHNHAPRMAEYQHGSLAAAAARSDPGDM